MALLIRGLRGDAVKLLQQRLEVGDDGIFGPGTEKALKAYQEEHDLVADGKAGADTFASMGLYELILLKRGSKGALVAKMQGALEIDDDGKFGPGTEKSGRAYQTRNDLEVDGRAAPTTLTKMGVLGPEAEAAAKGAALWASVSENTEGTLDKLKSLFT